MRFLLILLAIHAGTLHAQVEWRFSGNAELTEHMGRSALRLQDGTAILDGADLQDGVIEFDIAFSGERGFAGVMWRMVDEQNYEHFYLRPHQSGNPDANQYTPVYNGVSAWQLYYGEGYGAPVRYEFNEWIRVKLVFWDGQAEVYIGDMETPTLRIHDLKRPVVSGGIGFSAQTAQAYVSDFSYSPIDLRPFDPIPHPPAPATAGTLSTWDVSDPFDGASLDGVTTLDPARVAGLAWQPLRSEPTGITNLASLHSVSPGHDTVFARAVVQSDRAVVRALRFGYSDRVKVYVNGRAIYAGDNTYRSRDYRYLGTIGYFDTVFLPLREGDNELVFAVTEAFGGWGLTAQFE